MHKIYFFKDNYGLFRSVSFNIKDRLSGRIDISFRPDRRYHEALLKNIFYRIIGKCLFSVFIEDGLCLFCVIDAQDDVCGALY